MQHIVGAVLGVIYSQNCRHHTRFAAGLAIHAIVRAQLPTSLAESCCEVIDQVIAVPLCCESGVQELVVAFLTLIVELHQASLIRKSSCGRLQASLTVSVRNLGRQLAWYVFPST